MSATPSRRLFFALWPDEATREALHHATRKLARHCGGRPVPPGNFHVTLAFLGPVPAARYDEVVACGRATPCPRVELALERTGFFPQAGVLWLGPAGEPPLLADLARRLHEALAAARIPADGKPFHPHLTLARKVRVEPVVATVGPVRWPVADYALVESHTEPEGPRYEVCERF